MPGIEMVVEEEEGEQGGHVETDASTRVDLLRLVVL